MARHALIAPLLAGCLLLACGAAAAAAPAHRRALRTTGPILSDAQASQASAGAGGVSASASAALIGTTATASNGVTSAAASLVWDTDDQQFAPNAPMLPPPASPAPANRFRNGVPFDGLLAAFGGAWRPIVTAPAAAAARAPSPAPSASNGRRLAAAA